MKNLTASLLHAETTRAERVLCVDDEPELGFLVQRALEKYGGMEVRVCADAAELYREVEAFRPDVVLLDVMMPDEDGVAALARLRALPAGRDLPIIFLTARARPEELARYGASGAQGVIAKPFDPRTLSSRIRELCRAARPAAGGRAGAQPPGNSM